MFSLYQKLILSISEIAKIIISTTVLNERRQPRLNSIEKVSRL